ncbi:MAG: carboxypeptidase regulatory-like domain-containing protein [Acidobacteriales bacterium]|nr:carboxypeptidase regulatory-like domain-containing protein [Terriglobales bacterium]
MKSSIAFKLVIALAVTLALVVPVTFAQAITGTISGVIKDPNGAVVPGAKVVARNAGTNATTSAITDVAGTYKIINLVSGEYVLEVEAKGFRKTTTIPQRLSTGDVLRLDLTLELGQVTETVTVEEMATKVNTEDAQMGQVLRDVYQLPILSGAGGRNALNLATLQPGVMQPTTNATVAIGNFSVNGQRSQSNNYVLDGGDSNDMAINVPDAVDSISPNALSEFRVVTGSMKAEYGRNSGAQIMMTTRSGSNQFHGGAAEVFRNTKLNTTAYFQNAVAGGTASTLPGSGFKRRPQWNTNDFDAQFGGPIKRDKSFFFVSYLGFRRRQGVTTSGTVISDADRALINQYGTTEAKNLLALAPHANYGTNTFLGAPANQLRRDQGLGKFDHYFSPANTFGFSFYTEDREQFDPISFNGPPNGSPFPGFGSKGVVRFTNMVLRDTHTFNANVFNEFRASFHRRAQQSLVPENNTSLKSLGITGVNPDNPAAEGPPFVDLGAEGYSAWGNTYQGPQSRWDNTTQVLDNVNWTRGKHYMKFGFETRAYAQNQLFSFINSGYIWSDGTGVDGGVVAPIPGLSPALTDFARGYSNDFEQSTTNRQGYRSRAYTFFFQDDWKIAPTFTLNIGVRWEDFTPITEIHDQIVAFRLGQQSTVFPTAPTGLLYPGDAGISRATYDNDLNNFGPRIGFAWDTFGNGKLAVRGGYGLFYDSPITELTLQFLGVPPYGAQTYMSNTFYRAPYALNMNDAGQPAPLTNPFPFVPVARGAKYDYTQLAPIGQMFMAPDFATPYGQQANLSLQYQIAKDWLLDTGYVWTSGVKLLDRKQFNYAIPGPGASTLNINSRRILNINNPLNAQYGGAVWSNLRSQLSDANSNYNGLQMLLSKRFGHGLMMTHAYTWSHTIDMASGLRGYTRPDNSRFDRGNADMDVRHRYVAQYIYELPVMKDQKGVFGKVLGGWSISGITTFQTGQPFDIYENTDRSLTGIGDDRPDYVGGTLTFFDPRGVANVPGKLNAYFDGTGGGTATAATNPFFRRVGSGTSWAQGAGRWGSMGRNVFHGPGINNFDFSVFKRFRISEGHSVEFTTQFFNLWNHTQFGNPSGNIGSGTFGRITTALQPRLVQLGLKYMF